MTDPARFRKKPVVIEAMQLEAGSREDAAFWIGDAFEGWQTAMPGYSDLLRIRTLEGVMEADDGDWIIKGVAGEFYPCKPGIFAATYEPAEADDTGDGWIWARVRVADEHGLTVLIPAGSGVGDPTPPTTVVES